MQQILLVCTDFLKELIFVKTSVVPRIGEQIVFDHKNESYTVKVTAVKYRLENCDPDPTREREMNLWQVVVVTDLVHSSRQDIKLTRTKKKWGKRNYEAISRT